MRDIFVYELSLFKSAVVHYWCVLDLQWEALRRFAALGYATQLFFSKIRSATRVINS